MMIKNLACAAALLSVLPLSAGAAALDFFLKIDTVKGESSDSKHKDWIDVLSWSWGVSTPVSSGPGSSGRPAFAPFSWEQGLDSSFVPLFLGLVEGRHFDEAELEVVRAGKDAAPFFQMILRDPQVIELSTDGSGDVIKVDSAMVYDKITLRYRKQKADGSYDAWIEGSFDLKAGKVSFTGDPGALRGLVEAGGTLGFIGAVPEPESWASLAAGLAMVAAVVRRRHERNRGAPPARMSA